MARRSLILRTDGAARGNPGPAGAGFVIETPDGTVVEEGSVFLGRLTNNQAEYEALLHALEAARPDAETALAVYTDSELMARQLNGEYRVRHADLKPRYVRACQRLLKAGQVTVRHVPRGENARADALANRAIDMHFEGVQGTGG